MIFRGYGQRVCFPWLWRGVAPKWWDVQWDLDSVWTLNSTKSLNVPWQCQENKWHQWIWPSQFQHSIPDSWGCNLSRVTFHPNHWGSQAGMLVGVTFMTISWHLQPLGGGQGGGRSSKACRRFVAFPQLKVKYWMGLPSKNIQKPHGHMGLWDFSLPWMQSSLKVSYCRRSYGPMAWKRLVGVRDVPS